jgi:hypothetical protein
VLPADPPQQNTARLQLLQPSTFTIHYFPLVPSKTLHPQAGARRTAAKYAAARKLKTEN